MRLIRTLLTAFAFAMFSLAVYPVYGHAFGQRYDLPIPLGYFLIGAAAAVALSFVVIGMFVQKGRERFTYPRLNLLEVPLVGAVLTSGVAGVVVRTLSVAVFMLLLLTGFLGTNRPIDNLSPTFIWIIWWVGMGYIAALLGNVWMFVNPWKITFEWFQRISGQSGDDDEDDEEALFRYPEGLDVWPALLLFFSNPWKITFEWFQRISGQSGDDDEDDEEALFRYPEGLDVWPALLLFFLFAWSENVFTGAFRPFTLSVMVALYSLITWAGMAAFGKHTWLRHGEVFSVLFSLFARFSPTEVRVVDKSVCAGCHFECSLKAECIDCIDCYECYERADDESRELNLRPFAVGLAVKHHISIAMAAFVILTLATVSFDGFQDTETWASWRADLLTITTTDVVDTLGLSVAPLLFACVYVAFCWGVRLMSGDSGDFGSLTSAFVFSLVPIALAYNIAHFVTLLLIQGQLIIPLASDPFGFGWDIFGSAGYNVNLNIISAKAVWFISLAAIVLGHVISVYLAHLTSLRLSDRAPNALRGQIPMLALMVLYTVSSLWIIGQPIVN